MTFGLGVYYVDLVALAALPLGARRGRAELLLLGVAALRFSAGHLRDGALDGGAPVARDLRREGGHGRAREDVGPRDAPRAVRGHPVQRGARRARASRSCVLLFQRGEFDAVRRAPDGARARVAGRRHLHRGRGAPARARVLLARRHAHARHRQRPRPGGVHRARALAARSVRPRRRQHGRRRLERRADDPALRRPEDASRHDPFGASSCRRQRGSRRRRWSAAVAGWGAARILAGLGEGPVARAMPGLAGVLVFGVLYFAVAWGLGSREVAELAGPVRRRLARRARRD